MSHSNLKQLLKAEELFDAGKLDGALKILNDENQFEGLNLQEKNHFQFLKGLILLYHNKSNEVIYLGEKILKEGQKRDDKLQCFDGLYFIITGLAITNKFNEAFKKILEIESLLDHISSLSENDLTLRKIRVDVVKAFISLHLGNPDLSEKCLEWILNSQKRFEKTFEIVWANLIMAENLFRIKSKFKLSMEYTKKALSLAKEIKFNHHWIALCRIYIGVYYGTIGELDLSLEYHMKGLKIFKKIKSTYWVASVINNIGNLYGDKGEYDLALEYLEESLRLFEKFPHAMFNIETPIDSLITLAFEHGDNNRANKYFHRLEEIYEQKKGDKDCELIYKFNKALMLKNSSRIRDKAKAEVLLKKVVDTKTLFFDIHMKAHIHLCDLLLAEYRIENNSEVLNELNHYIAKLLTIAEKQHSYLVFCETFILQAKLSLINFDIKSARRFLSQAQKIAESYGLTRLAMKISHEHDELLKKLNLWEKLKDSNASISERWNLSGVNEQMNYMLKKHSIEVPELSDEVPVLLLIVSEGGMPFFTQSFIRDKAFEDHLFGGFFTAINSFINEMFSEGLDRVSFGKHTLLMNTVSPFLMCYVYKGQSYSAHNRIKLFIKELKNNKAIWNEFKKCYNTNRKIQIKDIPTLKPLINKIFEDKSSVFM